MSNLTSNHKNKRILQIIPNMEIGGAERTVLEITSFLKKNTNHTKKIKDQESYFLAKLYLI